MTARILVMVVSFVWMHTCTMAQVVQPSTKTITKTFAVAPSDNLVVAVEKASVEIDGWDKNLIELQITFSSSHPDATTAKKELEYMHYAISRDNHTIEVRNAFILPAEADNIKSKIEAKIQAKVPSGMMISISNKYGDIGLTSLSGKLRLTVEFSDLLLTGISGDIAIQSSFCEVRSRKVEARYFSTDDNESKYVLGIGKGFYSFKGRHADYDLTLHEPQSVSINGTFTDVTIQPVSFTQFNYILINKDGHIYLPEPFQKLVRENGEQTEFKLKHAEAKKNIIVKTSFNNITIQ